MMKGNVCMIFFSNCRHRINDLQFHCSSFRDVRNVIKYSQIFFRLPPDTDPLFWLKNTHPLFVTRLILSHLLSRFSEPYGSLAVLSTVSTMKVKEHLRPSPAIDVTVERITFKSEGFLLQAHVTLSPEKFHAS